METKNETKSTSSPQQQLENLVSQEIAILIYTILRYFYTEEMALEATREVFYDFLKALPASGYKNYSKLLALRFVHLYLKKSTHIGLASPTSSLGKENTLILLLHDRFHFSCKEIGAVIGIAEGSIQTRLARLASVDYFKKQNEFIEPSWLMEKLKAIPLNSIFVSKKGRLKINWAHLPWYFKILLEGFLATVLIAGILFLIPKIKQGYEFWLERRLDVYNNTTDTNTILSENTAPTQSVSPVIENTSLIKPETEFVERDPISLSQNKTYRILIKSNNPSITKTQVLEILKNDYKEKELPSGVILDAYVPIENYKNIIETLSHLGETQIIITHSKDPGFKNKAHFVIWLQTI